MLSPRCYESQCDSTVQDVITSAALHFRCDACAACFASQKALQAHQRTTHKQRAPQRYYSDRDGVCPVCQTIFKTRLRLLAHLSDTRRDKCWNHISTHLNLYPRIPEDRVIELDAVDREQRRTARQEGHTHPIAIGSARTAQGRAIGHVRR